MSLRTATALVRAMNYLMRETVELTVGFGELAFGFGYIIDPSSMNLMTSTEQALPARDRVCANNRAILHNQQLFK